MRLVENFIEQFHNDSLPPAEKCLLIEEGDELYIKKWIKNGKINGKAKDMFEWIEKKYLNEFLKIDIIEILSKIDIEGKELFNEKFITDYLINNILQINPDLK